MTTVSCVGCVQQWAASIRPRRAKQPKDMGPHDLETSRSGIASSARLPPYRRPLGQALSDMPTYPNVAITLMVCCQPSMSLL